MILVLHQGAIGDFLLTLSALQPIQQLLRQPPLVVIAPAPSARLCAARSVVDRWISPERLACHRLFSEREPLETDLRTLLRQSSLVMNFMGDNRSLSHQRLSSEVTSRVISIDPRPTPETLTRRVHITQQWAQQIREAGLSVVNPQPPRIRLDDRPPSLHRTQANRRALIHPGSGGRTKCWPIERFLALADRLAKCDIQWMLGPAEREPNDPRYALLLARENIICEDDLRSVAEHMASADLFIGNDGGMSHLATALSIPTVILFGPTDPQVWRPLGSHVTSVATLQPGQAVDTIKVSEVEEAVRQAMPSA